MRERPVLRLALAKRVVECMDDRRMQSYRINSDIAWKIPKNHPTMKIIPFMRKNAAEFFRNPGLFSDAPSK